MNIWALRATSSLCFRLLFLLFNLCCSVVKLCPARCGLMDCSTPGSPVLPHLPELAQTYVHWVGDAIQPSHPLSPPSPPVLNLSQHQGLFQWVSSLHQMTKVLELQHQSFQWIFRVDFLSDWLVFLTLGKRKYHYYIWGSVPDMNSFIAFRLLRLVETPSSLPPVFRKALILLAHWVGSQLFASVSNLLTLLWRLLHVIAK